MKWILYKDPTKDIGPNPEEDSTEIWDYDLNDYAKRGLIKSDYVDKLYEAIAHAVQKMPRLH